MLLFLKEGEVWVRFWLFCFLISLIHFIVREPWVTRDPKETRFVIPSIGSYTLNPPFRRVFFAHSVSPLWPIHFPYPYFCLSVRSVFPPFLFIFSSINAVLLSYDGLWEPVYQSLFFFFIAALLSCHIVFVWETNSAAHLRIIPPSPSPDGDGVFGRCSDAVIINWGFSFALFFPLFPGTGRSKRRPRTFRPTRPTCKPFIHLFFRDLLWLRASTDF